MELFAGIGTAAIAMRNLGVTATMAACETDASLRTYLGKEYGIQPTHLWADVREMTGKQVCDIARQCGRHLTAVITVAGPPCIDAAKLDGRRSGCHDMMKGLAVEELAGPLRSSWGGFWSRSNSICWAFLRAFLAPIIPLKSSFGGCRSW